MRRLSAWVVVAGVMLAIVPLRSTHPNFVPDWTFKGSAPTNWQSLGQAGSTVGGGIPDFIVGKRHWAHEESYTTLIRTGRRSCTSSEPFATHR